MVVDFTVGLGELQRAQKMLAHTADELSREQSQLKTTVGNLLGSGWTGAAAESYAQGWKDWCVGADDVLAGLALTVSLLTDARATYAEHDEDAAETMHQARSRIQTRMT